MTENIEKKPERTVLSHKLSDGPHGLGDPNDKFLRKVERNVLIPKKVRERSKIEKCVPEVNAFNKCCKESGLLLVFKCRKENQLMKECLSHWFYNKEFIEECTKEYLEERSEFRRTGIPLKERQSRVKE